MGNSDEMNECIGGGDFIYVGFRAQRVTVDDVASGGHSRSGARSHQGAHVVAAAEQFGGEAGAEESGGAGKEDLSWRHGDLSTDINTEPGPQTDLQFRAFAQQMHWVEHCFSGGKTVRFRARL